MAARSPESSARFQRARDVLVDVAVAYLRLLYDGFQAEAGQALLGFKQLYNDYRQAILDVSYDPETRDAVLPRRLALTTEYNHETMVALWSTFDAGLQDSADPAVDQLESVTTQSELRQWWASQLLPHVLPETGHAALEVVYETPRHEIGPALAAWGFGVIEQLQEAPPPTTPTSPDELFTTPTAPSRTRPASIRDRIAQARRENSTLGYIAAGLGLAVGAAGAWLLKEAR